MHGRFPLTAASVNNNQERVDLEVAESERDGATSALLLALQHHGQLVSLLPTQ